jgi:rhodanese-related sulfurtransferase
MPPPITKRQVEELQQQNNSVKLIDIRTPEEYEKMHIPGAVNIPIDKIPGISSTAFSANDAIVCVCTKGQERSQHAAEAIAAMGFTSVYYLKEGTIGWLDE